ncbi:trimeric intracellular cation channel family protein [Nocardioides mangrovicus]|uniref:Trimeric intracellular cation channel family protein n=1 Tax=Nocardioides mangrovicus TaxID=2478913 RepID=A0A3L8P3X5_9ACTN|nr:trimeric intracellular cation channel family protein [Nocardioides mangrovicus]RLV49742.1 trimeric intracellular cation channel family protein [Nocardioides mangrovicus]
MAFHDPYAALELLGTIAFAVSGAEVAARAGMDWVGISVLAVVAAVGGGTVRDLLLGLEPVGWISRPLPVWMAVIAAGVVIADAHRLKRRALDARTLILLADAVGLAVFTVTGAGLAYAVGASRPVAVLLGVVTGVGGGVARDVLARQSPLVLAGQVYALAAVAGGSTLMLLDAAGVPNSLARGLAVGVGLGLRLLAISQSWSLPRPLHRAEPDCYAEREDEAGR